MHVTYHPVCNKRLDSKLHNFAPFLWEGVLKDMTKLFHFKFAGIFLKNFLYASYLLFWILVFPHPPLVDFFYQFFLPTSTDVCASLYNLFLSSIKVCHCCLCFPNIFSPQCLSALAALLQHFADVACVSCQYGASLSAQLDRTHLLFSYQDLEDVTM